MIMRIPAEVFPPGELLKEELDCRGWTQAELSEILDRPPRLISEIVSGKRAITPETAKGLAAALGTSAEYWMNLETTFRLSKTTLETSLVERRARLYGKFPVKEMIRRGWVKDDGNFDALEASFCRFFDIPSLDDSPTFKHAAKQQRYDSASMLQLAWLKRAEQIAQTLNVGAYSVASLRNAVKELKGCLENIDDVKRVPGILAKAGVRFVVVEYLPGAKLDGACCWIAKGKSPVIAISLRLDRLDNFWHTLFHEIDHVLHGEGKNTPIVDVFEAPGKNSNAKVPAEERRASESAAGYCIDQDALNSWIAKTSRVSSRKSIVAFAQEQHVHPALVVGQLQHRDNIPYSFHRELLEKVRSLVIDAAVTDGFGGK